jgi:hypothetical protein
LRSLEEIQSLLKRACFLKILDEVEALSARRTERMSFSSPPHALQGFVHSVTTTDAAYASRAPIRLAQLEIVD